MASWVRVVSLVEVVVDCLRLSAIQSTKSGLFFSDKDSLSARDEPAQAPVSPTFNFLLTSTASS